MNDWYNKINWQRFLSLLTLVLKWRPMSGGKNGYYPIGFLINIRLNAGEKSWGGKEIHSFSEPTAKAWLLFIHGWDFISMRHRITLWLLWFSLFSIPEQMPLPCTKTRPFTRTLQLTRWTKPVRIIPDPGSYYESGPVLAKERRLLVPNEGKWEHQEDILFITK